MLVTEKKLKFVAQCNKSLQKGACDRNWGQKQENGRGIDEIMKAQKQILKKIVRIGSDEDMQKKNIGSYMVSVRAQG
jgi:hypothetical protein